MAETATDNSRSAEIEELYEQQNQGKNHGFAAVTFYFFFLFISFLNVIFLCGVR